LPVLATNALREGEGVDRHKKKSPATVRGNNPQNRCKPRQTLVTPLHFNGGSDVLVGNSTPATAALLHDTHSIPIVFVGVSDPLGSGLVTSIAWPGGNVTGFTNFESSLIGKWLELLKEVAPGIGRVAVISNPKTSPDGGSFFLSAFDSIARSLSSAEGSLIGTPNEVASIQGERQRRERQEAQAERERRERIRAMFGATEPRSTP
jgi:hypothetical protein